ncbi:MAG TPA: carbohydrate-binding family 9-like protein [Dinghuibacter sp.]|jgi:hypothetical protein|uniref:carbohydrate-binding family 9-like protein n=1 Tax=Dinghuibacter sp. TaxID=2024697 RepID=UPI002B53E897|nr:carbohydrate-binding family 9-like protein [Dinghuibacter sp.]HTJ12745.1 carbohydrate-binding family 9-like protein [Dinghuibacter sp.]
MKKPLLAIALLTVLRASAQDDALLERLTRTPLHYVVPRADVPPRIDGTLGDLAWQQAPWTDFFTDIEGDIRPTPLYHTRVKMLWDDHYLYVGAELEEPQVWGNVSHHDEVVFHDNDFEVFVNPDNNAKHYFEIEINALATIFDLFLPEPYRYGGNALVSWDADGLKKAVHINGTLNRPGDTDQGWTVELAIPITSISIGNGPEVPQPGSLWRINFSRVEWDTEIRDGRYVKRTDPATGRPLPEHNWVWSPQGVVDMHLPERWGYLLFAGDSAMTFSLPATEALKNRLWEVFYREQMYRHAHDAFADAATLAVPADPRYALSIEATTHTFKAFLSAIDNGETWSIDPMGNIRREK